MFKRAFLLTILCLTNASATANNCNNMNKVHWLSGQWLFKTDKLTFTESWEIISNKTLEGSGQIFSTSKNKIISDETLRIVEMSNELFYLAKVASNSLPIAFKLTYCDEEKIVFENPLHDFPQKLIYQQLDKDHINVLVSGSDSDNKQESIDIHYARITSVNDITRASTH